MQKKFYRCGFTLIEVLVVIGLLGLLAALAIPFYQSFQVSSQVDTVTHEIMQTLRTAQARAMSSQDWQSWGVHFASNKYSLYSGTVYQPGNNANEDTNLPGVVTVNANHADFIFDRVSGTTSLSGQIVIKSSAGNSRTITINSLGVVDAE